VLLLKKRATAQRPLRVTSATDTVHIIDAMVRLPPLHRQVIHRSHYMRWPSSRIAADLEISERLVKSTLHYALHALRLTLREMELNR
jgi:RNA polymerase sigma-70 factor (ECF subfamily)